MFSCGQYPAYDEFLALVKEEAEQNVKRLRHHPSVVIFGPHKNIFHCLILMSAYFIAGNNEG
jgi:beta-galactosidase/beta-glucuronidase